MRKISETLALMSLLAPLGANALGIGDIRLHSALNQSLDAEIPLVTSGGDDLTELHVTLASQEAFSRAGIERNYALTKLRFVPQQKSDGHYVIKVSSPQAIDEPFLNFMIEVHWPQGRLLREFTVLLDPPASFQEDTAVAQSLPETQNYRPARASKAAVATQTEEPVKTAVRPIAKKAAPPPPSPAPGKSTSIGGVYGPVSKNETLWRIAQHLTKDPAVSQSQMQAALFRANPQAFNGKASALKTGSMLTVPDSAAIKKLLSTQAAPAKAANSGRLSNRHDGGTEQGGGTEPAAAQAQGKLKLLAPTTETSGPGVGRSKGDKASQETIDSLQQENEDIRGRLGNLEQRLLSLQGLLKLRDEQIATLQTQRKSAVEAPPQLASNAPLPAVPATSSAGQAPALPIKETARAGIEETPSSLTATTPQPAQTPATNPEAETAPPPPIRKPPPPTPAIKPTLPQEEPKGFFATLFEQSYGLIGAATGLVLIGYSAWLVKRRRAAMIEEEESILTLESERYGIAHTNAQMQSPTETPVAVNFPMSQQTLNANSRSSFLSEFTPSDFDALGGEMEEVDPISEADVYLAYGRYKQAEELIRSAIEQNPERDECKLKLFEIHHATENSQAFEEFAEELAPTHRKTKAEFWEKVVEMGRELCPASPLFVDPSLAAAKRSAVQTPIAPSASGQDDEDDFFFTTNPQEMLYTPPTLDIKPPVEQPGTDDDLHDPKATIAYDFFAMDDDEPHGSLADIGESEPASHVDMGNVIAFEMSGKSASDEATLVKTVDLKQQKPEAGDQGGMDLHANGLDYDLNGTDALVATQEDDKSLDEILAELGVLSKNQSDQLPPKRDVEIPEPKAELSLATNTTREEDRRAEELSLFGEDEDFGAAVPMDELETKLDLAKAYCDMGDKDSARTILEGVAAKGTEEQKAEALALIKKLDRS